MAEVTLTLTDAPGGVLIKLHSDVPLPQPHEDGGTVAQNLVLMALATVQQVFYTITGKAVVPVVSH